MDFKRIQVIFIVAFFFLDVFLLISYFNRTDTNYATTPSQSLNLINEMDRQKIDLPDFTEEKHSVAYVQADVQNLLKENIDSLSQQTGRINEDGSLYASILSNPIQLSGESDLTSEDRKKLDQFVQSEQVLFGKEYRFFRYQRENGQIIYTQTVNGLPIADGTSAIILYMDSSNQIISYEQRYAGPVTEQGSKIDLITDRSAVETLFQNNKIPANSKVYSPVLTYYRTLKLEDLSMYAPVWYVRVEESSGMEVMRVDAINGSILTDGPAPSTPSKNDSSQNPEDAGESEEMKNFDDEQLEKDMPEEDSSDNLSWMRPAGK